MHRLGQPNTLLAYSQLVRHEDVLNQQLGAQGLSYVYGTLVAISEHEATAGADAPRVGLCADISGWEDSTGLPCSEYASLGYCAETTHANYAVDGVSATEACRGSCANLCAENGEAAAGQGSAPPLAQPQPTPPAPLPPAPPPHPPPPAPPPYAPSGGGKGSPPAPAPVAVMQAQGPGVNATDSDLLDSMDFDDLNFDDLKVAGVCAIVLCCACVVIHKKCCKRKVKTGVTEPGGEVNNAMPATQASDDFNGWN